MIWIKKTVVIFILATVWDIASAVKLKAVIQANGLQGTVTFDQPNAGQDTTVTVLVTGLANTNTWSIKSLRVKYDVANRCNSLGATYTSLNGPIPSSGSVSTSVKAGDLNDLRILCGRSILLTDSTTNKVSCGNLEEEGDHLTAIARFQSTIAGTVAFRQLDSSATSCTSVFTDLFQVTSTENASPHNFTWFIYEKEMDVSVATDCRNLGSVFNPKSSQGTGCSKSSHENCRVGDLTGKHNSVDVGVTQGQKVSGYVDMNLALSGSNSVAKKTLVLKNDNGDVVSCARIKVLNGRREAKTLFSRNGITGMIKFSQLSPYDPTAVKINLQNLQALAGGFHIHNWPVQQKIDEVDNVCDGDSVSGHFNPFGISNSPQSGTDDQYEIGDLSGKYGNLNGNNNTKTSHVDYNLPLFGRHSVIGRSIVIHKRANGERWACATIQPMYALRKAVAVFKYKIIGRIALMQAADDWEMAETQIFVELNYANRQTETKDHKWHIHMTKIKMGSAMNSAERCNSVTGHYNPFSVDLSGNYAQECNSNCPLRCELGDLSGKHGKLSVRTASKKMWRAFFTDVDLPLSGPESVIARSIVIHDADNGASRLSCADLGEVAELTVKVSTWDKMMSNSATGTMTFTENSMGFLEGITNVDIDVDKLSSVDGFHVHKYPVPLNYVISPCSSENVGGHFAPLGVTGSPMEGTDDQYEIGDLSGKYGHSMKGATSLKATYVDTNLPLRGVNSIAGRSVVIHKDDGKRWVCGTILQDTAKTKGKLYKAKAEFTKGPLTGSITLSQYRYQDGSLSDTGILIDLKWRNQSDLITTGHKWHVHEKVMGDKDVKCSSTGPHYNPYLVDTQNGYDECSKKNALRCELGDQSGKVGLYDVGNGPRYFTDVNLDLVDQFSVNGRSFVVHEPLSAAPRLACADILPVTNVMVRMSFVKPYAFTKENMVKRVSSALHTASWNLALKDEEEKGSCKVVMVYLTGENNKDLQLRLKQMVDSEDSALGMYAPTTCGAGKRRKHKFRKNKKKRKHRRYRQRPRGWGYYRRNRFRYYRFY